MQSCVLKCWTLFVLGMLLGICGVGCTAARLQPASAGGAGVFDVLQFGAKGDGQTLNTDAFARAVAACEQAGGGSLYVPPGRYLTGPVELKSHIRLCINAGSILLASRDARDYALVEDVWVPGGQLISPLIYAHDAEEVAVSGGGTIDGQGATWWAPILEAKARHRNMETPPPATQQVPSTHLPGGSPGLPRGRPELIRFLRCSNVVIEGITLLNSPEWNIHPLLCDRVRVDGVTITAPDPSPNTDGINPESCRTVQILNCRIDNGDDCITLKSGADAAGRRIGRPDEDITIANCVMYHGHGGVTIGSEMSGGVHDVVVTNCIFHGTDNGLRIKSQRGRGGIVEGISISNIVMQNVAHPFVITSFYMGKDKPGDVYTVGEGTPQLRDILISNITARGATEAGNVTGLREMPVSNITFDNVHVQAKRGFVCSNAAGIRFNACSFHVDQEPTLLTRNCTDIESGGLQTKVQDSISPVIEPK
jgi:polygalacturonase